VITSLGPHPISSASDVADVIGLYQPGDRISIGWASRTGQAHTGTVTFASGPAD
jgi:S1-C subfamily serine protease